MHDCVAKLSGSIAKHSWNFCVPHDSNVIYMEREMWVGMLEYKKKIAEN